MQFVRLCASKAGRNLRNVKVGDLFIILGELIFDGYLIYNGYSKLDKMD